ncbi:hypothetical protein Kfla_5467 [Kribbella flavida DSM 17836]|uniref:DUF1707 domain-containing protein n=1 Tax=Kribbella flavida (strain DSM 17836 / JCM 10339 / NBRC 14399) TaxID=479435 RepID=D2PMB0_KRIFD|nr:hypothetical protein [Kribbella flavida]ADB34478.1 hypothetical protein Kfla_5467 [Kribbella flavida DSM 17836]
MNAIIATLGPLLDPDELQLTEADKRAAHAKLDSAVRLGGLSPQQATDRHDLVGLVHTRGELRRVFDGLPDAVPPTGLTLALRSVTVGWLVVCSTQFAVWLGLAVFGHFDGPWWLWSDLALGTGVGILWWTHESYHRKSSLQAI